MNRNLSRRDFLKTSLLGLSLLSTQTAFRWQEQLDTWPTDQKLGRNCTGGFINLRAKPSEDAAAVNKLYEDAVVVWQQEVVGQVPAGLLSRRWVETPEGYLYAPSVQPVYNKPNQPITSLPESTMGKGVWMEVTVPYVDVFPINPAASPWLQSVEKPRLYYGQVMWIDDLRLDEKGVAQVRVGEPYGSYGDIFWADARAFRQITDAEIAPINPEKTDKKIVVNLNYQNLSCFEGNEEVYFCRISSGAKFNAAGEPVDFWSTPVGPHPIYRKLISMHMSGTTTGAGWDTPGIGWTCIFAADGASIHSTFWHNDFGVPRSHGCVNALPEDAKWIFRWCTPVVSYIPGDMQVGLPGGTIVDVVG